MATGSISFLGRCRWAAYSTVFFWLGLCVGTSALSAAEVGLAGILGSKAMLTVDGAAPQAVAVGQQLAGVRLLALTEDQAVIEVNGRKRALRVGQQAGVPPPVASEQIVLTADARGHFLANGAINGVAVRFVVDTGATLVSLGASDARRVGLDFNRGEKGYSQTANGQALVSRFKLDSVRIGDVTLYGVDALVHQSEMPVVLLGMSFLNRMQMLRDGPTMTLKKRY